ncbi:MAG TPA: hypothetical protein VFE88_00955 [Candidatus Nanoarchaeia archaeon]|nr:hypothetical protein [Candidatus Nanoarchaeia archaeon]
MKRLFILFVLSVLLIAGCAQPQEEQATPPAATPLDASLEETNQLQEELNQDEVNTLDQELETLDEEFQYL